MNETVLEAAAALMEMSSMLQEDQDDNIVSQDRDETGVCTAADDRCNSSEAGMSAAGSVMTNSQFSSFQQEPYREVLLGVSKWTRQDAQAPPSIEEARKWHFMPKVLLSDHAEASLSATQEVFGPYHVLSMVVSIIYSDQSDAHKCHALSEILREEQNADLAICFGEDWQTQQGRLNVPSDWDDIVEKLLALNVDGASFSHPDGQVSRILCMGHARIWIKKHRSLLVTPEKEAAEPESKKAYKVQMFNKITTDFHQLQSSCLTVPLNTSAFDAMILYWKTEYKQDHFADLFAASWRDGFVSRAKSSSCAPGAAILPNHNNGPEGHNRADKEYFNFERAAILPHIIRMQDRVQDKSWNDDIFGCGLHREVWCGVFFHGVQEFLSLKVCPLDIYWKVGYQEEVCGQLQQEDGIIIPSRGTILAITNNVDYKAAGDKKKVKEILSRKTVSRTGDTESWIATFKHLLTNPEEAIKGSKTGGVPWDFHLLLHWMTSFRVLVYVKDEADIVRLTRRWQYGSYVQGKTSPAVIDMEKVREHGIVRCKCGTYMLREFCVHVAAYNIKHGIMKYPVNFDPAPTGKAKRGRPANALRGGALDKT